MKRAAEETSDVPTLGQVAAVARFEPLRQLISSVKDTPVTELTQSLRTKMLEGEVKATQLLLEAFFAACDARAADFGLKRANVEKSSGENFKHQAV